MVLDTVLTSEDRKRILTTMCQAVKQDEDVKNCSVMGVFETQGGGDGVTIDAEGREGPCDGAEADVVIAITGRTKDEREKGELSETPLSETPSGKELLTRARRQLFILTQNDETLERSLIDFGREEVEMTTTEVED